MSAKQLKNGFYPALGTPVDNDGKLIDGSYSKHIDAMISSGAAGVLCMGTMGKMESILNSEYPKIAPKCLQMVSKRVPVMVGVMDCSAARVLDRIDALGNIDIEGVVATPPFYSKVSPDGIVNFFTLIAKKSKYPVFIYDLPPVTQSPVTVDILEPLMKINIIVGIKTANINMILHLLRNNLVRPGFSIFYSGLDNFDVAIQSGIKKNLDGMFACTPYNTGKMYDDIENGDADIISNHLNNILTLRNIFAKENILAAFSYSMGLLGYPGNYHCDYASTVTDKLKDEIHNQMKNIKEI